MKKVLFILFLFVVPFISCHRADDIVTNVSFRANESNQLEITYDLLDGKEGHLFTISAAVSTDGGSTFSTIPKSVHGDFGSDIRRGKCMVWDVLKDVDELDSQQLVVEVRAVAEEKGPSSIADIFLY